MSVKDQLSVAIDRVVTLFGDLIVERIKHDMRVPIGRAPVDAAHAKEMIAQLVRAPSVAKIVDTIALDTMNLDANGKPRRTKALMAERASRPLSKAGRAVVACTKCGELGRRSDGCGRTHNVKPSETPATDADEESAARDPSEVIPPSGQRPDPTEHRPSEAHAGDDASSVCIVAGTHNHHAREPKAEPLQHEEVNEAERREHALEAITRDRREMCGVHGWLGRYQFHFGRHDLCVEPIEATPEPAVDPDPVPESQRPKDLERADGRWRRRSMRQAMIPRAKTVPVKKLTRDMLRDGAIEVEGVDTSGRPLTRGDCKDGPRPCPWVGCKHHLYLEVNPETGSIKFNRVDIEPDQMLESCALDVAERGGSTLEYIAEISNITRERVRQIEVRGLSVMKRFGSKLEGAVIDGDGDSIFDRDHPAPWVHDGGDDG